MTALYLERYLNYGLTRQELQSGKPIIGIARPDRTFRPATGTISSLQSAYARASVRPGGIVMEFSCPPDPGDGQAARQPRWTATLPISAR